MKTYPILLAVIGLGLVNCHAQEPDAETAVRAALEETRAAIIACDIGAYAEYWHEEGSIFTVAGDPLRSAAVYLDLWRQVCADGGGITFVTKDEQVSIYGDVAVVITVADWTFQGAADGTSDSGRQRSTTVLLKSTEGWKIVHAHGSALRPGDG